MLVKERLDSRSGSDEVSGEVGKARLADYHQQSDAVPHDRGELIRLVAYSRIVRKSDPASTAAGLQPLFVGAVGREVLAVPLDPQAGGGEYVWKGVA